MTAKQIFQGGDRTALVGVITSAAELRYALRLQQPPDLFELRLDLYPRVETTRLARLPAPLILTARHPDEGGRRTRISRHDLLQRFLPGAAAIDVELRSLRELREVWEEAKRGKRARICSFHDLNGTPSVKGLREKLARARKAGADLFKVVTRADQMHDFLTLMDFLENAPVSSRLCVMAMGKFGKSSRLFFPPLGSQLVYAPLLRSQHSGQIPLAELSKLLDPPTRTRT